MHQSDTCDPFEYVNLCVIRHACGCVRICVFVSAGALESYTDSMCVHVCVFVRISTLQI